MMTATACSTILIAEDEASIRGMAQEYLEAFGFKVVATSDAPSALDIVRSDATIRLVFTDIQMPGALDGYQLCAWLKANRPGLPVLLTSGRGVPGAACSDALHRFIAKPYDLDEVETQIEELLRRVGAI